MDNGSSHWWNGDHDTTKFPLYTRGRQDHLRGGARQLLRGGRVHERFVQGSLPEQRRLRQQGQRRDLRASRNTGTALTKVEARSGAAPGLPDARRVLELVLALRHDGARFCAARSSRSYMIGVDPGPPLPGATMIQPPAGTYTTDRERTEALVNQSASCMGCHTNVINPPGFVLENYDAIGAWQTVDKLGDGPINPVADGQLRRRQHQDDPQRPGADAGARPAPRRGRQMYAQSWVSYALRTGSEPERSVRRRPDRHQAGRRRYPILNVLADLTQADSFRLRVRAP